MTWRPHAADAPAEPAPAPDPDARDPRARGGSAGRAAPRAQLSGFRPGWFWPVMDCRNRDRCLAQPGGATSLAPTARTLSQVMTIAAFALAVPSLGRMVAYHDSALAALRVVAGPLYGTLPGAILVLAAAAAAAGPTWFSAPDVRPEDDRAGVAFGPATAWNLTGLEWADAALFPLFWLTVAGGKARPLRTGQAWRPARG